MVSLWQLSTDISIDYLHITDLSRRRLEGMVTGRLTSSYLQPGLTRSETGKDMNTPVGGLADAIAPSLPAIFGRLQVELRVDHRTQTYVNIRSDCHTTAAINSTGGD